MHRCISVASVRSVRALKRSRSLRTRPLSSPSSVFAHRHGLKARKLALLPGDKCRREKGFAHPVVRFARSFPFGESGPAPLARSRPHCSLKSSFALIRYVLFITHYCGDCRFICCRGGRLLLLTSRDGMKSQGRFRGSNCNFGSQKILSEKRLFAPVVDKKKIISS